MRVGVERLHRDHEVGVVERVGVDASRPPSAYSSSAISACRPAPGSTATSYPSPVSLPTSSGTIATRASPSRVSFATAIFTRREPRARHRAAHRHLTSPAW